ncbi:hypothetical protein C8R43DRAFT_1109010 [Mycena crocata]|nr:hypothetical protein C8R43DRAFT_1109010 [Mycena crocata]
MAPTKQEKKAKSGRLEDLFIAGLRQEPGGLCAIGLAHIGEKVPRLQSNKFLRAAMRFLAGDRTVEEHEARVASMSQCRCDLQHPLVASLHENISFRFIEPLTFVLVNLIGQLTEALKGVPPVEDDPNKDSGKDSNHVVSLMEDWSVLMEDEDQLGPLPADWILPEGLSVPQAPVPKPKKKELGPDDSWPSGHADVFPSAQGVGKTLKNLLQWARQPCGSSIFLLIVHLGKYSPSFEEECRLLYVTSAALSHLKQALERFEARESPVIYPSLLAGDPVILAGDPFFLAITSVTQFLLSDAMSPRGRGFEKTLFLFSDLLLELSTRILPVLADVPGPEAGFCKQWWKHVYHATQCDRLRLAAGLPPLEPDAPELDLRIDVLEFFRMMQAYRTQNGCKRLGCQNKSDVRTMMICKRCALACYCNAGCQKQAWSKHKRLCNSVDALRRAMGQGSDVRWKEVLSPAGTVTVAQVENTFVQLFEAKGVDPVLCTSVAKELGFEPVNSRRKSKRHCGSA